MHFLANQPKGKKETNKHSKQQTVQSMCALTPQWCVLNREADEQIVTHGIYMYNQRFTAHNTSTLK